MTKNNLTLDEAIKHIEDVIKDCDKECKIEHLQLKKWLLELKELRKKDNQ